LPHPATQVGRRRMQLTNVSVALIGSFCLFLATVLNPQTSIVQTQDVNAHLTGTSLVSTVLGFVGFLAISLSYGLGAHTECMGDHRN
jgi:hypothetical protein